MIKMIYTSYFGKVKNFSKEFEPICIARWKPKWYHGKALTTLAPPESLLKWWRASNKDQEAARKYTQWYIDEVLNKYHPQTIKNAIYNISKDKIPVLVCFEKNGFCHRHIVAHWLKANGINCEEWSE